MRNSSNVLSANSGWRGQLVVIQWLADAEARFATIAEELIALMARARTQKNELD